MKSRLFKTSVAVLMAIGVLATPAAASAASAAEPVAGCGAGFSLVTVQGGIDEVDWRIYTDQERPALELLVHSYDANTDGHLCMKQYKPNKGQDKQWGADQYMITQLLDNKAAGRLR